MPTGRSRPEFSFARRRFLVRAALAAAAGPALLATVTPRIAQAASESESSDAGADSDATDPTQLTPIGARFPVHSQRFAARLVGDSPGVHPAQCVLR